MEPAQIKQAWAKRGFSYTLWSGSARAGLEGGSPMMSMS